MIMITRMTRRAIAVIFIDRVEWINMDSETRNAAIGAACVLLVFGFAAYYLPTIMLAVGKVSTVLAALVAIVFVLSLFVVLWLRGRSQRKKGL